MCYLRNRNFVILRDLQLRLIFSEVLHFVLALHSIFLSAKITPESHLFNCRFPNPTIPIAATITMRPPIIMRFAEAPASFHSPVRNPPTFELTAMAPMNSAQPTDGPSLQASSAKSKYPKARRLPHTRSPSAKR